MTRYLVSRANLLVFGVLVSILLLIGGLTWERMAAARVARNWSEHTYQILLAVKDLDVAIRDAETGQRGFLLTGDDSYLAPYEAALGRITFLSGELQRLTADNPQQQARLRVLSPLLQRKLEELAQTIQLRRIIGLDAALRIVRTDAGRGYMRDATRLLSEMSVEEQTLLSERLSEVDQRGRTVRLLTISGTLVAVLALIWAARLLNRAWSRSRNTELEQRSLALRLRTSLDSLSQGVGVFNRERELTNWNECFQVLLDLPKSMLRPGAPYAALAEFCAEAGRPHLETEEQIRHGKRESGQAITYEAARADGHQLELRRTPMPDEGFVLTVTDMTKRAQAESILREAQKMQAIGQLTGGIAHDFNNLLTIILGNLEFLKSKVTLPALHTRIDRATWAAQRGATLTGQLLAFARKQPLAPSPIDLGAIMPSLVPLLRRTLGEHINVRYIETAGLWPALADQAQLETALLNLALNARDAMPGGGLLTIELANKVLDPDYAARHVETRPGDYVMLAVSDSGHGMTPDVLGRVFEPFFTTKPEGKGTGLGLAMVFGFVKQSGGHINVYSEPGEGTTVRIYLPRAVGAMPQAGPRSVAPLDLPRGSGTILVVEDEPAVREIAVEILNDLGYRVLDAVDGAQALQVFGAHAGEIDLLLTDVVLPGSLRGRDLAERLHAVRPTLKVLYMSGYTENSIVHQGRLDDGVHLLGKPFKREQLARKVADVLGGDAAGGGNVVDLPLRRP